jgi:hypothetical protein
VRHEFARSFLGRIDARHFIAGADRIADSGEMSQDSIARCSDVHRCPVRLDFADWIPSAHEFAVESIPSGQSCEGLSIHLATSTSFRDGGRIDRFKMPFRNGEENSVVHPGTIDKVYVKAKQIFQSM